MSELPRQGDIPPMTLGLRLYASMQYAEISREKMADAIGVHPGTVSRWTHDNFTRPPSKGNLRTWAQLCGVREEWLIDGIGVMPTPPAGLRLVTGSEPAPRKAAKKAPKRQNTVYCSETRGKSALKPVA